MKPYIKKIAAGLCLCGVTVAALLELGMNSTTGFLLRVVGNSEETIDTVQEMESSSESGASGVPSSDASSAEEPEKESASSAENDAQLPAEEENASTELENTAGSEGAGSHPAESEASSAAAGSSSQSGAVSETPGSSSAQSTADAQAQIDALVAKLYKIEDKFERELLEIIRQAHLEYISYPPEQRGTLKKVAVVMGKVSDISAMEKECDAEVKEITDQMTTILQANGMDTAIVREVQTTYKEKKSALKKELVDQTYSGGDGSGTSGHWLYDRLDGSSSK